MIGPDTDARDPAIDALFDDERARPAAPADALERIARRGEIALALHAPRAASGLPGAHAARWIATFVAGGILGAGVHRLVTRTPHAPVAAASVVVTAPPGPLRSVAPPPAVARLPTVAPVAVVPVRDAAPSLAAPRPVAPIEASTLGAEEARLAIARTALGRGQADAALAALAEHERRYPRGQLVEEREGLAVQALVLAGRGDEARARAARFARGFPHSMFRPTVEASLRSISPRVDP